MEWMGEESPDEPQFLAITPLSVSSNKSEKYKDHSYCQGFLMTGMSLILLTLHFFTFASLFTWSYIKSIRVDVFLRSQ